jgi:hypothetical protein
VTRRGALLLTGPHPRRRFLVVVEVYLELLGLLGVAAMHRASHEENKTISEAQEEHKNKLDNHKKSPPADDVRASEGGARVVARLRLA